MAGYQKIILKQNNKVSKDSIGSTEWILNTIPAAEALVILNLVWFIYQITKNISVGLITIYSNNLKIVRAINCKGQKASQCVTNRLAAVQEIKRLIKKLKFTIKLKYQKKPKKKVTEFSKNPLVYLLQECDIKAASIR